MVEKNPAADNEGIQIKINLLSKENKLILTKLEIESRRKKKRSSRWGSNDLDGKAVIPGMPTILPSNMTPEQEKAYLSNLKLN
jgi:hypothetical protein